MKNNKRIWRWRDRRNFCTRLQITKKLSLRLASPSVAEGLSQVKPKLREAAVALFIPLAGLVLLKLYSARSPILFQVR